MAVVGFPDGSYIELISTVEPGAVSPVWDAAIRTAAGPTAWAARTGSIADDVERLRRAGIPVRGPERWSRRTPEGRTAEWELAFPGTGPPGSLLAFLIQDTTPREWRVRPTPGVEDTGLQGVGHVIVLCPDALAAGKYVATAYDLPEPAPQPPFALAGMGVRLQWISGSSVCPAAPAVGPESGRRVVECPDEAAAAEARDAAHATPAADARRRLRALGVAPAAFLLRPAERRVVERALPLGPEEPWPGGSVRWITDTALGGRRLGVGWSGWPAGA